MLLILMLLKLEYIFVNKKVIFAEKKMKNRIL